MKKSILQLIFFIVTLFFLFPIFSFGQFPLLINFQGRLTDLNNNPVPNGYYNMEFKLWKDPISTSSEDLVWTETCTGSNAVFVQDGFFTHLLGSVASLDQVNFNQPLWLGVNIGGTTTPPQWDGEMVPRKPLGAVPAAFEARKLAGFTWESPGPLGSTTPNIAYFSQLTILGTTTLSRLVAPSTLTLEFPLTGGFYLKSSGDNIFTFLEIDADGNLILKAKSGKITIPTSTTFYIGDIPVFTQGQEIVRGTIPVLASDLPIRCKTSCLAPGWARVSKTINNNPFPPSIEGTQRKYRFVIRYADTTLNSSSTWEVFRTDTNQPFATFSVPSSNTTNLEETNVFISEYIDLPSSPWYLRVQIPQNYTLAVYEVFLVAIDKVD